MPNQPGISDFPTSLDTAATLLEAANDFGTTLTEPLTASATVMSVTSTGGAPATGALTLSGSEVVFYTGKTGTTFTGLVRGGDGTLAAAHATGASVEAFMIARHHNVLSEAIRALQAKLGAGTDLAFEKSGAAAEFSVTTYSSAVAGQGSIFKGRRSRGTKAAPSAVLANDQIVAIQAEGYGTSGFASAARARVSMFAAQNWDDVQQGVEIRIEGTLIGALTRSNRVVFDGYGNSVFGASALATNAIDGFIHVPGGAGAPTGVPRVFAGRTPLYFDALNFRLYAYIGGAWRYSQLTL